MPPVLTNDTSAASSPSSRTDAEPPIEPPPDPRSAPLKHRIHQRLLARINLDRLVEIDAPRMRQEVRDAVTSLVEEEEPVLAGDERGQLIDEVLHEVFGLGPLEPLMRDPTVSDILVTTPRLVYVERAGRLEKTGITFTDDAHLQRIIQKIVSQAGRRIDESRPMVDARLPDGSRINAVIAPIAVDGPMLSIRRFSKAPLSADDLVAGGSLSRGMMDFLQACVRARLNILVVGGTGSGKTTLLNVLSAFIGDHERIITIEDTAELQFRQEHVGRMETRPPNLEGEGAIDQRQLLINTLRMRPDRIVIGEVRGDEALDMLQAMNTGHDGSLATIHANSCQDSVARLEMMVGMANSNLAARSIRRQISRAIHLFVHVARLSDGTRKVTEIAESRGFKDGEVELEDIFVFDNLGVEPDGSLAGSFTASGAETRFLARLLRAEPGLDKSIFHPRTEQSP